MNLLQQLHDMHRKESNSDYKALFDQNIKETIAKIGLAP
jgi:hypothetical protein